MGSRYISISFAGRARIVVDGDVENAGVYQGTFQGTFDRTVEVRDVDAPENQGGGSAQPTPDPSSPV